MKRRSFFGWLTASVASLFVSEPVLAAGGPRVFTDMKGMLDAISAHTRATGHQVFSYDRPADRVIGFVAFEPGDARYDVTFEIRMTDFVRSAAAWRARDPEEHDAVCELLKSQAGRVKLAMAFPGQRH